MVYAPVIGIDVIPTTSEFGDSLRNKSGTPTNIGILDANGWVQLTNFGGGRATLSSLEKAADTWSEVDRAAILSQLSTIEPSLKTTTLQEIVDAVRSPSHIDANSSTIGIFLDGTWSSILDLSNVARMYNSYQGTKFYYGGVGNSVDSKSQNLAGALGGGFTEIIREAEADILSSTAVLGPKTIQVFGFSRGAAEAIELAYKLKGDGITVEFMVLYDPVYSVGLPGNWSRYVETSTKGNDGNYVLRRLPANVQDVTVIYAMNERRTAWTATKLIAAPGNVTQITNIGSPGVHPDVGGHWEDNAMIQQLTMSTIELYAEQAGAQFVFNGIDPQIQALLTSDYSAYIAVKDAKAEERNTDKTSEGLYRNWTDAWENNPNLWREYTQQEYVTAANSQGKEWNPGPVGLGFSNLQRRLDWVYLGLWDTYPGIDSEYMKKLYDRIADPNGGWRA